MSTIVIFHPVGGRGEGYRCSYSYPHILLDPRLGTHLSSTVAARVESG